MNDRLINTTLLIVAVATIAGTVWLAQPQTPQEERDMIARIQEREILSSTVSEDIFGSTVQYSYVGDELPETLVDGEVVSMRTPSSFTRQVEIINEGTQDARVAAEVVSYAAPTFVERDGTWHYIAHDTAPKEIFDAATQPSLVARLWGTIAEADSATIYAAAGDGYVNANSSTSFAAARSAATGSTANATGSFPVGTIGLGYAYQSTKSGTSYLVGRTFYPFDTSSIPANAEISSATFVPYFTSGTSNGQNDGWDFITVVQSSQGTHTTLTTADFDTAGAVTSPTEGIDAGQRKDITSYVGISSPTAVSYTLNATGRGWIKKSGESSNCSSTNGITCLALREGHDAFNVGMSNVSNLIYPVYSENTGTASDPYLSVSYTIPLNFAPWMFMGDF